MHRLYELQHRATTILVVDYSDLPGIQETIALIRASSDRIVAAPPASVRVLMQVRGARIMPQTVKALKEAAMVNRPHLKGVAVVGLSGLLAAFHAALSMMMDMEMPLFERREDALDWLAALP